MGTVAKTLKLLNYLSAFSPEIGLSEFARLSGYDKASTHRRLSELVKAGFLEQDPTTKAYRLGAAIPRLALVREQTFPASASAMKALDRLFAAVQETVHVSIVQGTAGLSALAHIDDQTHGNRVYIEPADMLPYHATASGLVVMAYADDAFRDQVLAEPLSQITDDTSTQAEVLQVDFEDIRRTGFGRSEGGYETGIYGISAPLFDRNGTCCGAVAVATPKSRLTEQAEASILAGLSQAATDITVAWGGSIPAAVQEAWMQTKGN